MKNPKQLNVIFIGQQTFPNGTATTKRRRYIIDYLNSVNIPNAVLVTYYHETIYTNEKNGVYCENTPYVNIHEYAACGNLIKYYKEGKRLLDKWFDKNKKNVLIFPTSLWILDFPFFIYARKKGYKIIFDQVETSYLKVNNLKLSTRAYYWVNERLTKIAYKKSASFVISSRLLRQNKVNYPDMPIAILPNSTPILCKKERTSLNDVLEIVYAGTYAEKEGVKYLIIGALKASQAGCQCKLTLLGKAPDALKEKYSDCETVDFRGFVSEKELNDVLGRSDILAMVRTNSEFANFGFPFKLSEYLASGGVVIATKVGDVPEVLKDGVDAYLIEPENEDAICDVILRIKANPEEALRVARNGLKTAQEKFGINSVGEKFVKFLDEL